MNAWLVGIGLLGLLATVGWYSWLLEEAAPRRYVEFLTVGDIARQSLMLWLLTTMLCLSVVVTSLDVVFDSISLLLTLVLAALMTEVVRRYHNRGLTPGPTPEGGSEHTM